MKKIFKYALLILFVNLSILLFNQSLVKAATSEHTVTINGQKLNNEYKYLVNGERAKNGTLGNGGCTAEFNSETEILTLNGYNGGGILTGQGKNLTIMLVGNNKITVSNSSQAWGIYNECGGTLKITSDSEANLTINVRSSESNVAGIRSDIMSDSIIIGGKANIIVNGYSKRNKAVGIYAKSHVYIVDDASFNATLETNWSMQTYVLQSGIETTKPLLINTTGNINLDVSKRPSSTHSYYGYGIYSTSTMQLKNVGTMTIKYPSKEGDAWNASWTIPEKFAVNEGIVDGIKTKEIHSGSGAVHTLTLESAINVFGKSTGQYFNGDIIEIFGTSDVKGLEFKYWLSSAGLVKNNLVENTTFTMPDSNATVTANYSPFTSQPKFTRISSSSGKIDYTLNGIFDDNVRRLVKSGETAEDDFSIAHEFLSTPYEINEGTETHQVPAGEYRIAVKNEDNWYYSDIFTVKYDEQIIEDNTKDANEITDVDGTSKENNTQQNGEKSIIDAQQNEEKNIIDENSNVIGINNTNKLPQTGEKNNGFVNWLLIAIPLGIFWLCSMLLIEYEKKKITKG